MNEPATLVGTGILVVQGILLWRMRGVEREQHYHGLMLHWIRNALVVWAHETKTDIGKPPDRAAP